MRYCHYFDCTWIIEWRLTPEIAAIVAFLLLCGFMSSKIAARKGRSGQNWFWIGVLLGPIGLVWSLIIVSDSFGRKGRVIEDGTLIRCSHCRELVRAKANTCRLCNGDLSSRR